MHIEDMQTWVEVVAKEKGWFDEKRTFYQDAVLIRSEVEELLEAFGTYGMTASKSRSGKPEGVQYELADILARVLDLCARRRINIIAAFKEKMEYNENRIYFAGNGEFQK